MKTDPRVDEYIANAADFAKPILTHVREVIHKASPEITESAKWGMPHFEYHGVICSMAAFKQHCAFGFWKESLIPGMTKYVKEKEAMGQWGRITAVEGLPPDKDIIKFVHAAMELNEKGIKVAKKAPTIDKTLTVPDYFTKTLAKNKKAQAVFEKFSYSAKKEYVEWLTDAKTEETRQKRLETAIEWIAEGKPRMWKYIKK